MREQEPVSSFMDSFSQYPVEVQEAINRLKSQYQLEDGDIETVVNNLWSGPPDYYEVTQVDIKLTTDLNLFATCNSKIISSHQCEYSRNVIRYGSI